MVLLSLQGELGFDASVASTDESPARCPPGWAVPRRCPAAPGNAESHPEPGKTCSSQNILLEVPTRRSLERSTCFVTEASQ